MSLREDMQDDVSAVFLNSEEHAEAVRYRVGPDGLWTDVTVIVDRGEGVRISGFNDGTACPQTATIYCQSTTPLDTVTEKSQFEFDNYEWQVERRPDNDGIGMMKLMVSRLKWREKSARDYRLNR